MPTTTRRMRITALILCAALLLLSACTSTPEEGDSGGSSGEGGTTATSLGTGRYMEEQLSLPATLGYLLLLEEDADGDLILFGSQEGEEAGHPWGLWRSGDAGTTWTAQNPVWLEELRDASVQLAALAPDGGLYLYYVVYEQDGEEEAPGSQGGEEPGGDVVGESAEPVVITEEELAAYTPPPGFFVHAGEDSLTEMPFSLPTNQWGYTGDSIRLADNGDLLYLDGLDIRQLDGESGSLKYDYNTGNYLAPGYLDTAAGRLAVLENSGEAIAVYDLGSGLRTGEIGLEMDSGEDLYGEGATVMIDSYIGGKALAFDPEDPGAVYLAIDSGLYRGVIDSPVLERLIDGELTSLSMPSSSISRLLPRADGQFLVYVGDQTLLRYTFDPDVPTAPSTELRVYSLEENRSVRQFAGMFQLQNPEVKVSYTVGMPAGSAVTAADALRTLSTEILGGDGPDVLILDGLPVDSYIRQGALADLSEFYIDILGGLLGNVSGTYRDGDGAVWAIPARFTVPFLTAPGTAGESIGRLSDLADWAEGLENFSMENPTGDNLFRTLYPLLSGDWFDAEGTLDREAFAASLALVDRLGEAARGSAGENLESSGGSLFHAVLYASGTLSVSVDDITSLNELEQFYSAFQVRAGSLVPLPDVSGRRVFLPGTVLGVGAGSAQQELALEFVRLALSEEAQGVDVGDGLPVLRSALLAGTESPYGDDMSGGAYAVGFSAVADEDDPDYDPDEPEVFYSGSLEVSWPDQDFFADFLDTLESLEPVSVDQVVRSIALEEAEAYFAGSATLEGAVNGLAQKVELYLSERR